VLLASGLWLYLPATALERFELQRLDGGWNLAGSILRLHEQTPCEVHYSVVCDEDWRTKSAKVSIFDKIERTLTVESINGNWYANSELQVSLHGCLDLDLEWSPSTNTLPIRRLSLRVGQKSGTILAAWLRFPSLKLEPLRQEYVKVSERVYRYSSSEGAFVAELLVDENDVAVEYGQLWKRV
jgi:hypothetical protein